jgi:hypothetical protein
MTEFFRVVHQDYAHHVDAEPLRDVGAWRVFPLDAISGRWPGNGVQLVLTLRAEQVDQLDPTERPIEPRELPEPPPPPEPEPEPEPEELDPPYDVEDPELDTEPDFDPETAN